MNDTNGARRPLPVQPKHAGGIAGALALLLAALFGRCATAPSPGYSATAIMSDGRDVNVVVQGGKGTITTIAYDRQGHGGVTVPVQDTKDKLGHSFGVAPASGWGVSYMGEVAAKRRPLRYCSNEARAYDQGHGTDVAAQSERAIRDVYDAQFDILPSAEDCGNPDIVFGATAAQDCGAAGAWGCAAFDGSKVRVTVNGDMLAAGSMPRAAVYWIQVHEASHAGDLGHTGAYGGEGSAHPHRSNMGFICPEGPLGANTHPCDNATGTPGIEDWLDQQGGLRWGLVRRGATPPPPQPTAQPPQANDYARGVADGKAASLAALASVRAIYEQRLATGYNPARDTYYQFAEQLIDYAAWVLDQQVQPAAARLGIEVPR